MKTCREEDRKACRLEGMAWWSPVDARDGFVVLVGSKGLCHHYDRRSDQLTTQMSISLSHMSINTSQPPGANACSRDRRYKRRGLFDHRRECGHMVCRLELRSIMQERRGVGSGPRCVRRWARRRGGGGGEDQSCPQSPIIIWHTISVSFVIFPWVVVFVSFQEQQVHRQQKQQEPEPKPKPDPEPSRMGPIEPRALQMNKARPRRNACTSLDTART